MTTILFKMACILPNLASGEKLQLLTPKSYNERIIIFTLIYSWSTWSLFFLFYFFITIDVLRMCTRNGNQIQFIVIKKLRPSNFVIHSFHICHGFLCTATILHQLELCLMKYETGVWIYNGIPTSISSKQASKLI